MLLSLDILIVDKNKLPYRIKPNGFKRKLLCRKPITQENSNWSGHPLMKFILIKKIDKGRLITDSNEQQVVEFACHTDLSAIALATMKAIAKVRT